MINIAINGVCGRMGSGIAALVAEDKDLKLVAALESEKHPYIGKDLGSIIGQNQDGVIISNELKGSPDVLIDFTSPDSTLVRLKTCIENRIAMVIGTTGLDDKQMEQVNEASGKIACLVSPNMSIGVNLLFSLVEVKK